jgi:hypothetical protein
VELVKLEVKIGAKFQLLTAVPEGGGRKAQKGHSLSWLWGSRRIHVSRKSAQSYWKLPGPYDGLYDIGRALVFDCPIRNDRHIAIILFSSPCLAMDVFTHINFWLWCTDQWRSRL